MSIAIVTGGSQGFGLALSRALTSHGWTVITDARDERRLRDATAGLQRAGRLIAVSGDITDPRHRAELIRTATDRGGLDLLVHNASALGPSPLPSLAEYPLAEFVTVLTTNVAAPLALTQQALPLLGQSSTPTIVGLSSDAAVEAYAGWGGYGASKAALDQLLGVLGSEVPWARVYAFDPGDMRTAMHQRAFPGEDIGDRPHPASIVPALLRLLEDRPPSGRYRAADLIVLTHR